MALERRATLLGWSRIWGNAFPKFPIKEKVDWYWKMVTSTSRYSHRLTYQLTLHKTSTSTGLFDVTLRINENGSSHGALVVIGFGVPRFILFVVVSFLPPFFGEGGGKSNKKESEIVVVGDRKVDGYDCPVGFWFALRVPLLFFVVPVELDGWTNIASVRCVENF
jgi:hypothetical protein